jgi:hypothetical protein
MIFENHILFGYYLVVDRPLDMLFNAPTLRFIHTFCVPRMGLAPIGCTSYLAYKYINPTMPYHERGPMLRKSGASSMPFFGV